MRAEELSQLVRTTPFVPLRLHITNGQTYDVLHPDQIIVLKQRVDVGVGPDSESGVVERVEHLSLLHIVKVEEMTVASESSAEPE